jgi:hypothetical protein
MTIKLGLNYYSLEFIEVGARAITLSLIFNCIFCVFNVAARPALERLISSAFVLFKKGCMKFCVTSCNPFVQQHCWNRRRKALLFLCSFNPDIPGKHHPHFVHLTQKYIELTKLQVVRVVVRGLAS